MEPLFYVTPVRQRPLAIICVEEVKKDPLRSLSFCCIKSTVQQTLLCRCETVVQGHKVTHIDFLFKTYSGPVYSLIPSQLEAKKKFLQL